jgi:hypothetical protein
MKPRWWWFVYFAFAAIVALVTIVTPLLLELVRERWVWWQWVYIPLIVFQMAGLFGYVFSRRIGFPRLWQFAFVVSVPYALWGSYSLTLNPTFAGRSVGFWVAIIAFGFVLNVPLLIALFRYGFRSKDIWNAT